MLLVWHDHGSVIPKLLFSRGRGKSGDTEKDTMSLPADVQTEVTRTEQSNDQLRALHVDKVFGHDRVVDDVTFGVDGSQILALLGPNGAGKTTTLSMIRGDLDPSSRRSDILICNKSAIREGLAARQLLGVCPQFNTMDYMTVTEHLAFYARVRGVPDISNNVLKVIDAVGLAPYRHRMAGKLSGGNQRKLSLATSIIGNPAVLLLDEPSTGMDAVAMRVMWKAINAISNERAIVLTTHSMEEASALSSRTAIIDRHLLAVNGTQELVQQHDDGYLHVHLVLAAGANGTAADMQIVHDWIDKYLPGTSPDDEAGSNRRGQMRLKVPPYALSDDTGSQQVKVNNLVALINLLETHKDALGISSYSVNQATMEDVFLTIVAREHDG